MSDLADLYQQVILDHNRVIIHGAHARTEFDLPAGAEAPPNTCL